MSTKQFISSSQHTFTKQLQKFQLPPQRHADNNILSQGQAVPNDKKTNQDKLQRLIYEKISEVQKENEKLISIANQLNRSSLSFSVSEQLSSMVYPIEEQMKSAFNQLIESIQEFYIDIDTKIKEIGSYLGTLSGVDTLQTSKKDQDQVLFSSNPHTNRQHQNPFSSPNEQETIRSINMKIQLMQKDLKETKSNQTKLMSIIEKLVEKYELSNETTIVRDDPFLKAKVQGVISRVQEINPRKAHLSPQNFRGLDHQQPKQRFVEGNTFSKPNYHQNQILSQGVNSARGPIHPYNFRTSQNPQRNVSNVQNPNDYSIYQQLNKIQENNHQNLQNQRSFASNSLSQPKDVFLKNKLKNKIVPENMDTSMMSVNSYAYSNSMVQMDEEQCFIKKLYSKKAPSFAKVSLKNCNNPNKTVFQLNRAQEQTPIEHSNKNHRQAYLLNQLKRIN